jgi:hypothetical protein
MKKHNHCKKKTSDFTADLVDNIVRYRRICRRRRRIVGEDSCPTILRHREE